MVTNLVALITSLVIMVSGYSPAHATEKFPSIQLESPDKIETIASEPKIQIGNSVLTTCVANGGNCNVGKECKQDSDCGFITQGCKCEK